MSSKAPMGGAVWVVKDAQNRHGTEQVDHSCSIHVL